MAISKTKATAAAVILMILLIGGAAVVVNEMVRRPKPVTYSVPPAKPATQPVEVAIDTGFGDAYMLGGQLLWQAKTVGEPTLVAARPCSHLQKNPKLKQTACTSCHEGPAANLDGAKLNVVTGQLKENRLGAETLDTAPMLVADGGLILLGKNLRQDLVFTNVNLVTGAVLNIVDNDGLAAGTDAPAIEVKQADGTKVSLAEFKGKFVLLHFWDSKSKESLEQMPHLRAAARDWADEPKLVIVGINVEEKPDLVGTFVKDQKMEWTQGYAEPGTNLMQQYHVGMGAAVLIGPDGKIVAGALQGLAIDDALDKALRAPPVNAPARP